MSERTYFRVETRNVNYHVSRDILCSNLDSSYSVAACLRKRVARHGYRTMPMTTTDIHIIEFFGFPNSGRVVACTTWPGAPTMAEAIEAARQAEWRAIDPANPAKGACVPMPERRKPRL